LLFPLNQIKRSLDPILGAWMPTVLICDHDPLVTALLQSLLESRGYATVVVDDPAELFARPQTLLDALLLIDEQLYRQELGELVGRICRLHRGRRASLLILGDDRAEDGLRQATGRATALSLPRRAGMQELLAAVAKALPQTVYESANSCGKEREAGNQTTRVGATTLRMPAVETTIDGWSLGSEIGHGSIGTVFRAEKCGCQAALKLPSVQAYRTAQLRERFERETMALQHIRNPHVVGYLDSGIYKGWPYLAMQLIEAPNLKQCVESCTGHLEVDQVLTLAEQMACALGSAWAAGVVHRDVKPANILIDAPRHGRHEPFSALLCDFGLSRFRGGSTPAQQRSATIHGMIIGTPGFICPEQAAGECLCHQGQDVYGLGATLYFTVTGQPPFIGTASQRISRCLTEEVDLAPLRKLGLQAHLTDLLADMLARDPRDRPGWADVRRRLCRCRGELRAA